MPRLSDLVIQPKDIQEGKYPYSVPLSTLSPTHKPPGEEPTNGFNPVLRCPWPATGTVNPDSLRQFYRPGIPQFRVLTLK